MQFKIYAASGIGNYTVEEYCEEDIKPYSKAFYGGFEEGSSMFPFKVNIETLQDLLDIITEKGTIVVSKDKIYIYDDYIE